MTQRTPGTWESIPANAEITATRKDLTLKGIFKGVSGQHREKKLQIAVAPLGTLALDARDQWEVTYTVVGVNEVMDAAPVGTVWRQGVCDYPRYVKVSDGYIARVLSNDKDGYTPEIFPTIHYGGPAENFEVVPRGVLAEESGHPVD